MGRREEVLSQTVSLSRFRTKNHQNSSEIALITSIANFEVFLIPYMLVLCNISGFGYFLTHRAGDYGNYEMASSIETFYMF